VPATIEVGRKIVLQRLFELLVANENLVLVEALWLAGFLLDLILVYNPNLWRIGIFAQVDVKLGLVGANCPPNVAVRGGHPYKFFFAALSLLAALRALLVLYRDVKPVY